MASNSTLSHLKASVLNTTRRVPGSGLCHPLSFYSLGYNVGDTGGAVLVRYGPKLF